jgi:DNA repair protein RadC
MAAPRGMREVPIFISEAPAKNPRTKAPRYKISLVKEAGSVYVTSKPIDKAEYIYKLSHQLFEDTDRESFYVVALDNKSKIIGINLVSFGTLTSSPVHPREVFKTLILLNAAHFITVHNHPSGDPTPSMHDRELTARLDEAGRLMGITLQDHIVVGEEGFFSFSEEGILSFQKYGR